MQHVPGLGRGARQVVGAVRLRSRLVYLDAEETGVQDHAGGTGWDARFRPIVLRTASRFLWFGLVGFDLSFGVPSRTRLAFFVEGILFV